MMRFSHGSRHSWAFRINKIVLNPLLNFFFNGFNIVYSGYFTAIGKAKESIIIAACRGIIFVVIGICILPLIINIKGVWLTIPFAELMTFILAIKLIKKVTNIEVNKAAA